MRRDAALRGWGGLLDPNTRGKPKPRRGDGDHYGCGHPRTPENTIGYVQERCRICKREASEQYRAKNPDYFQRYRQQNRQYFIDYGKRRRARIVSLSNEGVEK